MVELPRRTFLQQLLCAGLAGNVAAQWLAAEAPLEIHKIRRRTLDFIESMRFVDGPYGRYRYAAGMEQPTLYSSTYAAMTRHLYRDLDSLSEAERQQWVEYLQSHQDEDGLFRDPVIFGEGWYADDPLWCGRPHLSCHVVTALACLDAKATRPLRWLNPFVDRDELVKWLETRDWGERVAWSGNEILNVGTLLQYARDFQHDDRCAAAVQTIYTWMEDRCDSETGLWGVGPLDPVDPSDRSHLVQAAYHFWLLWFYDGRPIPYADKAAIQVLRTQNPQGSFGWGVHNGTRPHDGSACEDIDSINPLARLAAVVTDRRNDILDALKKAEPWLLSNQTQDGGFCFMKDQGFSYGHRQLTAAAGAGGMFPTWFRTLTLAYLGAAVPDSVCGKFDWQFSGCPGMQFWTT